MRVSNTAILYRKSARCQIDPGQEWLRAWWAISLLSTGWALLAAASLLWPGIGTAHPDSALPAGFEGDRMAFEAIVLTPVVILVVVCGVFLALGVRSRRAAGEPVRA